MGGRYRPGGGFSSAMIVIFSAPFILLGFPKKIEQTELGFFYYGIPFVIALVAAIIIGRIIYRRIERMLGQERAVSIDRKIILAAAAGVFILTGYIFMR